MTDTDRCLLLGALQALCGALSAAGIPHFLYGGTLLGSWRQHGPVPWDDDVDLAVDFARQGDLRRALRDLHPEFLFAERSWVSWKFYPAAADKAFDRLPWRWPFVDICFYDENSTHVSEHDLEIFPDYVYPRDWVFPTVLRPLAGLLLPAPRRTEAVLGRTYEVTECVIGTYNHRKEAGRHWREVRTVPCDRLRSAYPFVERRVALAAGGCNETLVLNGTVLSWLLLHQSQC